MLNRTKRVMVGLLPLLVLVLINYVTFQPHFRGRATFPWDFLGGYHAQGFGWFDAGSVFSPPTWLPWSDMGFPAFLAIQSGAWYAPLALLDATGITYSVHVATVVQVLHVLFGAIGAYCLGRVLGWGKWLALFAALAYHFSATFYSNQQHVDIVRAAAWLPWLLVSLHPDILTRRRWGPVLSAFVLSQLLICGYPGNIIAAAYGCIIWVLALLLGIGERKAAFDYGLRVGLAVVAGVLMSMPKWLPVAMFAGTGLGMERVLPSPIMPHHLFTFLMPYEFDGLSGDRTMRAMWLPLAALWGIVFAQGRDRMVLTGCVLVAFALFMGMLVPRSEFLLSAIPGAWTSRFPVSDWRPIIHIGLILVAGSGWKRLFEGRISSIRIIAGVLVASVAFGMALAMAIKFGYPAVSMPRLLLCLPALLAISLIPAAVASRGSAAPRWMAVLPFVLLATIAVDGYYYYRGQPDTWRPAWNKSLELEAFGGEFDQFVASQPAPGEVLLRRPSRFQLGQDGAEILKMRNHSFYNRCWYAHSFCTFGYNNLRLSEPHRHFGEAVAAPGGDQLAAFAARPQQLLILAPGANDAVPALPSDADAAAIGDVDGVAVAFVRYGSDEVEYRISAKDDRRIVENEIWWPGWDVTVCDQERCRPAVHTSPTSQYLRSWTLPAGTWTIRVHFNAPSMLPAYLCFIAGLILALGLGWWRRMNAIERRSSAA